MKVQELILMENKLIKTDSIWYKIKNFFKGIFMKKKIINTYQVQEQKTDILDNILQKEKIEENNRKKNLAQKLLDGELGSSDLTDVETEEMIDYFKEDIKNIDQELQRVKLHIIEIRKELMEN